MSADAWIVLITLGVMVTFIVRGLLSPAAAIVAATGLVYGVGVIDAEDALAGLSNPAPVTVAGLYIVAGAVSRVDLLAPLVRAVAGPAVGRAAVGRRLAKQASADRRSHADPAHRPGSRRR